MPKGKIVLSWWVPIVLISVALMTPVVAQAGSIKIWPDQLKADYGFWGRTKLID